MAEGSELEALHFYVFDSCLVSLLEIIHFLLKGVFTYGSVKTALAFIKIVTTHRFADHRFEPEGSANLLKFLSDLCVKNRGSFDLLPEYNGLMVRLERSVERL